MLKKLKLNLIKFSREGNIMTNLYTVVFDFNGVIPNSEVDVFADSEKTAYQQAKLFISPRESDDLVSMEIIKVIKNVNIP